MANALEGMKVGIICLTLENLSAKWILYEAGALSKTLDDKTRVFQRDEVYAPKYPPAR